MIQATPGDGCFSCHVDQHWSWEGARDLFYELINNAINTLMFVRKSLKKDSMATSYPRGESLAPTAEHLLTLKTPSAEFFLESFLQPGGQTIIFQLSITF